MYLNVICSTYFALYYTCKNLSLVWLMCIHINTYAFRSQHSCEAQLFLTTNDWAKGIDDKVQVDMVTLDFSKALKRLSTTDWNINWTSMEYVAKTGNLLAIGWLESFLSTWTTHSKWYLVVLTLPIQPWHQGFLKAQFLALYCFCYTLMILLPTLTVSYVFVDDCLVYRLINSAANHQILQNDLARHLTTWTRWWQMEFNVSKCKILQLYSYLLN